MLLPRVFTYVLLFNPFTTGNPFLGTKLLGLSIWRGSGALKGLRIYLWYSPGCCQDQHNSTAEVQFMSRSFWRLPRIHFVVTFAFAYDSVLHAEHVRLATRGSLTPLGALFVLFCRRRTMRWPMTRSLFTTPRRRATPSPTTPTRTCENEERDLSAIGSA